MAENIVDVVFRLTETQFRELATVRDQFVKDGGLDGNIDVGSFTKHLLQIYGHIGIDESV